MANGNIRLGTLSLLILTGFGLNACGSYGEEISVTQRGDTLDVTGVIDAGTVSTIQQAVAAAPEITTLRLVNIPGSSDDEASLNALAALIKQENLATVVPAEGMVASGGTDMAVMSTNRVIEDGACVGVHSWAAGNIFGFEAGSDLPRSSEEHQLYLKFYETVDVPADFYWFTLAAAAPEDIHWMSPAEINKYNLSTVRLDEGTNETREARAARCNLR